MRELPRGTTVMEAHAMMKPGEELIVHTEGRAGGVDITRFHVGVAQYNFDINPDNYLAIHPVHPDLAPLYEGAEKPDPAKFTEDGHEALLRSFRGA